MILIRATHPYGFRSGEWAELVGLNFDHIPLRPCFFVRFPDGVTDYWPVYDKNEPYEFKEEG